MTAETERAVREVAAILPRVLDELRIVAEEVHRLRVHLAPRRGEVASLDPDRIAAVFTRDLLRLVKRRDAERKAVTKRGRRRK